MYIFSTASDDSDSHSDGALKVIITSSVKRMLQIERVQVNV